MSFWTWAAVVGGIAAVQGVLLGLCDQFGPNPIKGYLKFRAARDYADQLYWAERSKRGRGGS